LEVDAGEALEVVLEESYSRIFLRAMGGRRVQRAARSVFGLA
jgi:hypothetical protein